MALCACGCGEQVQRRGRSGPRPLYASHACRQRAYIARTDVRALVPIDDPATVTDLEVPAAVVPAQLERAVLEARAVGLALQRLGRVAPPAVAWRCTQAGDGVLAALAGAFGRGVL